MSGLSISDAQRTAQLKALKRDDPGIIDVVLSCSHSAIYVLERDTSLHWRKLGIEGFFYVVKRYTVYHFISISPRRNCSPVYRFLLRNQTGSNDGDFVQSLDAPIRFEVKGDTFFFQIGDHGEIVGLWFHDPHFMHSFVKTVEKIYLQIGLSYDGNFQTTRESSTSMNTTSGQAILQMLKKSDSSAVRGSRSASQNGRNPNEGLPVVDLLRIELGDPVLSVPALQPITDGSLLPLRDSTQMNGLSTRLLPQEPHSRSDSHIVTMTRSELREALRLALSSEAVLNEILDELTRNR
jgi:hypothetical protein